MNLYLMGLKAAGNLLGVVANEARRGTLRETLKLSRTNGRLTFAHEISHADLLEIQAGKIGSRPFLHFHGQSLSYKEMDDNANRVANYFSGLGAGPGQALAVVMKNSSRWLDCFFGAQKLGLCSVPTNIALRGAQLTHIINHSGARFVCIDHDLLPHYDKIKAEIKEPPRLLVNTAGAPADFRVPEGAVDLSGAYAAGAGAERPAVRPHEGDPCMLLYTSGTTGLPKGVATRFGRTGITIMAVVAKALLTPDDIYYTCLPFFHANALILTIIFAMHAGAQVAMVEKFSASRFWDEVRDTRATAFNLIGAMVPILMKQPVRESERQHRVKHVVSAACPADMWEPFEKRFGIEIMEGYGAVDGGGFAVMNLGQAPVGSMGKPLVGKYRLVDDEMKDVPRGTPGELVFWVGHKEKSVEYFKDEQATGKKLLDGWLHTGDRVYADPKGYLYFVGRKTEFLRRRGENISAYEVEHAILQHPDVLECTVFAVPSEMSEDEVMAVIAPVEGKTVDPAALRKFLEDRLAKFAIPRYYRIVSELPKTETQRVIKAGLEKEGVTPDTVDLDPPSKK